MYTPHLDTVPMQHEHIVFGILSDLADRRVLKDRPQMVENQRALQRPRRVIEPGRPASPAKSSDADAGGGD
jgi:hypothetical protein